MVGIADEGIRATRNMAVPVVSKVALYFSSLVCRASPACFRSVMSFRLITAPSWIPSLSNVGFTSDSIHRKRPVGAPVAELGPPRFQAPQILPVGLHQPLQVVEVDQLEEGTALQFLRVIPQHGTEGRARVQDIGGAVDPVGRVTKLSVMRLSLSSLTRSSPPPASVR